MADVNDMFNEVTKEQSFYVKGKKKVFTPFTKGEYYGHITEVDSKILDVKGGQYKARLYTYTVTVAPENSRAMFQYEGIDGNMIKTGERTFFWVCKFCKKWNDGKKIDISDGNSDIPF